MIGRLFCIAAACTAAISCGGGVVQPNVVIISMDTTRADRLGAYGWSEARTPTIDSLAAEGFLFRSYMTPVPITLPSHTTMFTGHSPPTHTVRDNGTFTVPQWELTLAEVLTSAGFDTSAFVASFPLHSKFGLDQGFAHYDDRFLDSYTDVDGYRLKAQSGVFFDERPATAVVDAAIAYHRGRADAPFFTFLHFFDPHQPLRPPSPYDLDFVTDLYDGEIAYVDEQVGRFFRFLQQQGEWDNTLIVVTADHGEALGEHGELTHAMLLHQATLHVPLIIRGPGVPAGESSRWAMSTSLMETVLDLIGVDAEEAPEAPRGPSLRPLIEGSAGDAWDRDFQAYFETVAPRFGQGWSQLAAWMEGDWRLVVGPSPRLYHLEQDPAEVEDRVADEPKIVGDLETGLRAFLDKRETESVGRSLQTIDQKTIDRLAALGYLAEGVEDFRTFDDMLDFGDFPDPFDHVAEVAILSHAKAAMGQARWELAGVLCDEMLRVNQLNAVAHRMKGVVAGVSEDWETSLGHLEKAVAIEPESMETVGLLGMVQIQAGHLREGIETLKSRPDAQDSVEACTWIGRSLADLGDLEGAEQWYRWGLEVAPEQRWLRLYMANLLAVQKRYDEAEPIYRDLIRDDPYFSLPFFNYGRMMVESGETERARKLLERARVLNPEHQLTLQLLRTLGDGE